MLTTMERRLYRGIMTPAAILTLVFGLILLFVNWASLHNTYWFWLKMLFVLALFAFHGACGSMVRRFRDGTNRHGHRFYRIFNELPLVGLIAIVFLVTFKPIFL